MQGNLPLLAVRKQSHPSFFLATLEARRSLDDATTDAAVADAGSRMMVQLHGLAECLNGMADTGLLNLGVSASTLQTNTRFIDGLWVSQTCVARAPPPACSAVRLPRELCASVMQALVILDAINEDPRGELVEFRTMAAMVVEEWPDKDTPGPLEVFTGHMRDAWTQRDAGSPSSPLARLARATTERLRGAARAVGVEETGAPDALEYTRRALAHLGDAEYVMVDR